MFTRKELKLVKIIRVIFWGIIIIWIAGLVWIYWFDFIPARDLWIMSL